MVLIFKIVKEQSNTGITDDNDAKFFDKYSSKYMLSKAMETQDASKLAFQSMVRIYICFFFYAKREYSASMCAYVSHYVLIIRCQ